MFRTLDDENNLQQENPMVNYFVHQPVEEEEAHHNENNNSNENNGHYGSTTLAYPSLDSSVMMMNASIFAIQDEGFEPIVFQKPMTGKEEEELTMGQQKKPVGSNQSSPSSKRQSIGNSFEGALNEIILTPRSSSPGGSNRSSRANSAVVVASSSIRRVNNNNHPQPSFSPATEEVTALNSFDTTTWNNDELIDIEYGTSGSSYGENELYEPIRVEPLLLHHHHDRSEFDLGIAGCREEIQDWRRFYELLAFLSEVPILNRIISFVYYPNLENILKSNNSTTNQNSNNSNNRNKNQNRSSSNSTKTIAKMLMSILELRLVNKKWKQSIDNPTGVLYHFMFEYSSIQKSISLKNLELTRSEFNFFSVPGIYMVGIGQIIGKTSLIPLEYSTKAYTKMEQDYGPAAANTVFALGAGITIASGSFALFMLSGAFYLLPIAAGGYVLDKAIELGMDYTNKKNAEQVVIQSVEEKEKALNSFRMKMRRITTFESIQIVKHEPIKEQGEDASLSGYLFSYASWKNNHSVYYIIQVTMVIDQSTYSYCIKKRYSQFEKLFKRMCEVRGTDKIMYKDEVLIFPTKEVLGTFFGWRSEEIIETRTKWFNKILEELVFNLQYYKEDEAIMVFLTDSDNNNNGNNQK